MRSLSILILFCAFLAGCATQTHLYYYGDYSQKYYTMIKQQDDASKASLIKSLENIINKSQNQINSTVPPGIYSDYGMILVSQSRNDEAQKYFNLEKSQWPESAPLMDYLIQLYK